MANKRTAQIVNEALAAHRAADPEADRRARAAARREAEVEALREGRKQRAHRFPDKRKQASRDACRKGNW